MSRRGHAWRALVAGMALVIAGCSSADEGPGGPAADARAGEIKGADTWKDGLVLSGTVTIAKDAVVDVEPGAVVTCTEGATLYVEGTLRARAAASHARIRCPSWKGVVVSAGGLADLEGLEIENALLGLGLAEGARESRFDSGAIVSALKPIVVSTGTKLTLSNAKLSAPDKVADNEISISEVFGTLVATRLEYDAKANEGLSARSGGDVSIEDSKLTGKNAKDLVSSYGGKKVVVRYTTLDGAHCGFHIDIDAEKRQTGSFELDHVSSDPNSYGMTVYGAGAGPNTVKDSNIVGVVAWLDFQGENGPITFDGVYTSGSEVMLGGPVPPTVKNKATGPRSDARPR